MRVLVAPDKFKDAADAVKIAEAMAAGIRDTDPDITVIRCPMADGGEGSGRLLARAASAAACELEVLDPLGRPRLATWWLTPDGTTAIVEMAEASGLALLEPRERDPTRTTSYGTGQLLHAAMRADCRHIYLCVGGSATIDGGAGCLQALGWKFHDSAGAEIDTPLSGGALARVREVAPPSQAAVRPPARIDVLCDVDNPLTGPRGAARIFGPQKGATPDQVQELEAALNRWADLLTTLGGLDVAGLEHGGAAGGLPAGLAAACQARLWPGFEAIASRVRLGELLDACDLCLTGEGRIDSQTAGGKVVAGVARMATARNVPVIAFAGSAAGDADADARRGLAESLKLEQIHAITPANTPLPEALSTTCARLRQTVARAIAARPDGGRQT